MSSWFQFQRKGGFLALLAVLAFSAALAGCSRPDTTPWKLTDISGHLPDLDFNLTDDTGKPVTGKSFVGQTTLVYFGYTHCPDVCPETMARLVQVLQKLGDDAENTRIVFITVDPARDTPAALHAYVRAFDAEHAVGLTGTDGAIEGIAKRYRVAYQMEKRDPSGAYDVTHSSAVYIFDAHGHARLLANDSNSIDTITSDVRRVIDSSSS